MIVAAFSLIVVIDEVVVVTLTVPFALLKDLVLVSCVAGVATAAMQPSSAARRPPALGRHVVQLPPVHSRPEGRGCRMMMMMIVP